MDNCNNNPLFQQACRWKFNCSTRRDHTLISTVQAAAIFLTTHPKCLSNNLHRRDVIQCAVNAIKVYNEFLKTNNSSNHIDKTIHGTEITKEVLKCYERFEKHMHDI
jgi:hypothetical protein